MKVKAISIYAGMYDSKWPNGRIGIIREDNSLREYTYQSRHLARIETYWRTHEADCLVERNRILGTSILIGKHHITDWKLRVKRQELKQLNDEIAETNRQLKRLNEERNAAEAQIRELERQGG